MNYGTKNWITFIVLCVLGSEPMASSKSLAEIYPNRLITPDFGIVTADDLAYDTQMRDAEPYDPNKDLLGRYWQCLPLKEVVPKSRTWRDSDSMGLSNVIVTMCDLEIVVREPTDLQTYGDRRAHRKEYCQEFMRQWRRLTSKEDIVCLNGDDPSTYVDGAHGRHRSWVWNKVKTRKGCYSYFGDCDVAGCAERKCTTD